MQKGSPYRTTVAICFAAAMVIYLCANLVQQHKEQRQDESRIALAIRGPNNGPYLHADDPFLFDRSISDEQPAPLAVPVLTSLVPQNIPRVSLADLSQQYPEFQHAPLDSSGFNPLQLPFRYKDTDNIGD